MDIESEVYYKDNNGDIIGANVLIYNDTEDIVEKIVIVEEKCLQALKDTLNNLDNTYLHKEELEDYELQSATTLYNKKETIMEPDEIYNYLQKKGYMEQTIRSLQNE